MKQEINLEELREKVLAFYDPYIWHFVTLNGTHTQSGCQLQWIFSKYNSADEYVVFEAIVSYDAIIPTIKDIIPSAIMSEMEVVDLFGLNIENTAQGLYLDETSIKHPLKGDDV